MADSAELKARLTGVAGIKTTTLTHYGRKSGKPYMVTIWFTVDGEHINLHTMNMRRQWTRNVVANGKVSLRIGNETFAGHATEITDQGEMKRVVALMKKKYPISLPYLWIKGKPDGAFRVEIDVA